MTDRLGHITSFTYDTNGNLTSVTTALGQTTIYTRTATARWPRSRIAEPRDSL